VAIKPMGGDAKQDAGGAQPAPQTFDGGTRPPSATTVRHYELTFDDGPHVAELGKGKNLTEKVLDTLKARGIKAGFFIQTGVSHRGASKVGRALVKRMHDEGHTIGIHTGGKKDHQLHTKAEAAGHLESDLNDAKGYVKDITGKEPTYVRPPTGAYNRAVEATYGRVGLTNMLWDIDGDAGNNLDLPTLKSRFTSQLAGLALSQWRTLRPDSINVLYHDIQRGTAENLNAIIDHIKDATAKVRNGLDIATFRAP
jgi:peptidoglycan/xylan/chitin deacetylase (PgdA/CDA1 family)